MDDKEKLTIEEAYLAMLAYLDNLYNMTNSDDLAGFLGGMQLMGKQETMDPAAWYDWLDAVKKVKE